jgi:hypothetical protein
MAQGIWNNDGKRFPSKKAFKEAVAAGVDCSLEATSISGNEYGGYLSMAPSGSYFVVGPCPHTKRNWYAQITVASDGTIKIK